MNAPPQPRERRRQERDFSGRRDGVRDKVNEFRARRDRRDEKSRNDRRGGALARPIHNDLPLRGLPTAPDLPRTPSTGFFTAGRTVLC